ncbi:hypothetical protein JOC34_000531 [Virgibacillus halotolerans]|uniref:hypothetical protein n=1 Tax=Virgibacillus halotolerans TaxID=1071053 RepID=UPI00195FF1FA|nr:hypothetical protein [Virgibacillus halotolerans]MBM7598174.1 hypothetical protein [Virgibacillus halotolerans]
MSNKEEMVSGGKIELLTDVCSLLNGKLQIINKVMHDVVENESNLKSGQKNTDLIDLANGTNIIIESRNEIDKKLNELKVNHGIKLS